MESGIPKVKVVLERSGVIHHWVIKECPYCGKEHKHGAGRINEDPDPHLGHRAAHCEFVEPNEQGYILVKEA